MSHAKHLLEAKFPGIYVRAMEIGNGYIDSLFWSVGVQVKEFCKAAKLDPKLAGGFNLIGFSQGGMITRGYIERCNDPPVLNYISWVAPQMGIYGVPYAGSISYLNTTLDAIVECCIYSEWVQNRISFAGYWKDPYDMATYTKNSLYLPDINNERATKNGQYKANILALKNFALVYSTADKVLIPKETGWFGFFAENSTDSIVPLEQTPLYQEDWIGLRTLDRTGRLHRFKSTCDHEDYYSHCFNYHFAAYVFPLLR
ncbi:Palmitoyl-protein thioesterase 1 [Balamuthia mandrillaris]